MAINWHTASSRIMAVIVFFLALVFFISGGHFWLAVLIPPPLSVLVMYLIRRIKAL